MTAIVHAGVLGKNGMGSGESSTQRGISGGWAMREQTGSTGWGRTGSDGYVRLLVCSLHAIPNRANCPVLMCSPNWEE